MGLMTPGQKESFVDYCAGYFRPGKARFRKQSALFASSCFTFGTLFLVRLLTRYARDQPLRPAPIPTQEADLIDPTPIQGTFAGRVLRLTAATYEHSLYGRWLHADGQRSVCRFIPSCTEYAVRAVEKHGIVRGLNLAGARFRRCQPSYEGDYVDFP